MCVAFVCVVSQKKIFVSQKANQFTKHPCLVDQNLHWLHAGGLADVCLVQSVVHQKKVSSYGRKKLEFRENFSFEKNLGNISSPQFCSRTNKHGMNEVFQDEHTWDERPSHHLHPVTTNESTLKIFPVFF